jgi:hypothetical protein
LGLLKRKKIYPFSKIHWNKGKQRRARLVSVENPTKILKKKKENPTKKVCQDSQVSEIKKIEDSGLCNLFFLFSLLGLSLLK